MMRRKHNILLILVAAIATLLPIQSKAQNSAGTIGAKLGYVTYNESALLGLFYQYQPVQWLRIAPEIDVIARHQDVDAYAADINLHFPLAIADGDFGLYPFMGLNLSTWDVHAHTDLFGDVASTTYSRAGFNIGAGFEYFTKRNIKLCFECKHTFNSGFSNTSIDFGVGYMF